MKADIISRYGPCFGTWTNCDFVEFDGNNSWLVRGDVKTLDITISPETAKHHILRGAWRLISGPGAFCVGFALEDEC